MNTKIKIVIIFLFVPSIVKAQVPMNDSIQDKIINLNEVVVKGARTIAKGDHTLLLLSKRNREFGTNALDAVSSLGLFRTKIGEKELISFDNRQVFILINGIPATALDLRAFKADEIKNVEYYPTVPAQYMTVASGPVANIIMKKRHNKLVSAYIDTNNAVNTGFGTNQVNLTYADSLNQVKVNYFTDYRNIGNIHLDSYYDYGEDNKTSYKGSDNRYRGIYQYVQTSYQRFQAKHLLNVNLKYILNPRKQTYSSEIEMYAPNILKGTNEDKLESNSHSFVADLFYRYSIGEKRSLAINVVNTLSKSSSYHFFRQDFPAYPSMDFLTDDSIRNRTYSFISNAVYSAPLLGGSFNAGAKYEYLYLKQNYLNANYRATTHTEFFYTGIYWTHKGMTFYPTAGFNLSKQTTTSGSNHVTLPYLRLYSDWWGKNKWQGFTIQLTTQVKMKSPTSGQLTTSKTYTDRNFISMGNPYLKQYWQWTTKLQLAYFAPNNNNQVVLQYTPQYSHRPFVPILFKDNDATYSQPGKIPHIFEDELSLFGSWYPASWLEISPYFEYHHSAFNTPSQKTRFTYFRLGGNITLTNNKWALILSANSPTKEVSGDLLIRGSAQYAVSFQYKHKDWAFGAKWNYSACNDYVKGLCTDFSYKENKDWKSLHSLIRLTATWSFSKGKARRHLRKTLHNENTDDGLTNDNTPKMAN